MEEKPAGPAPNGKPVLQKPPGYRDAAAPAPMGPLRPPPRKQPLPPSFRPGAANPKHYRHRRRRRRACCCRLCCWLCLVLLIVLFLLALAGALSYLWFQPKLPSFRIQSIQTPLFNVTSKPDGGSFVDARTVVRLQVSNPNGKIRFFFAPGEARVAVPGDDGGADDVPLGTATTPGLDLGRKNSTVLRFEARAKGVMVDGGVRARLAAGLRSKTLRLLVEVRTRVAVAVAGKRTWKVPVRVICGGLPLKQLDGAASPKCTINVLKWINIH